MAEAVEVEKHGPNSWLNERKFTKAFMMHSVGQRIPTIAKRDAEDAYQAIMAMNLGESEAKWMLETVAVSASKAMGVMGLIRQSQDMLKAI